MNFKKLILGLNINKLIFKCYKIYNIIFFCIVYMYYIDWFLFMVCGIMDIIVRVWYE